MHTSITSNWSLLSRALYALLIAVAALYAMARNAHAIPIEHIIVIVQENHSFDNYFGTYPGANGIPTGTMLPKVPGGPRVLAPFLATTTTPPDMQHSWQAAALAYDNGWMDGFYWAASSESAAYYGRNIVTPLPDPSLVDLDPLPTPTPTPPNNPPKQQRPSAINCASYYDGTIIPNYWNYAQHYTLCDNFFSALRGPSMPNHLYIVAAQSGGLAANYLKSESTVSYSFSVIMDELLQAGVTWKHYSGQTNPQVESWWNPLPAFPQISGNPTQFANLVKTSQFFSDLANGTLPHVCWLIPTANESEHPPNDITVGMNYVTGLVNAVMESQYWKACAIIITWDDYGGFYDHVKPIQTDKYGFGFRVPCLVISPYSLANTVVHTQYDFTSILKLIETKFRLSSLTGRDNAANNMLDCFNFSQTPLPPDILQTSFGATPH